MERTAGSSCLAVVLLTAGWVAGCAGPGERGAPAPSAAPPEVRFVDATAEAGLSFVHASGASGRLYMAEIIGAGAALFDCDGDGDLDLLLRQGGDLAAHLDGRPWPADAPTDRLWRNDLGPAPDGGLAVRFVDVTAGSGLDRPGYGMGVATGDFDGDGHVDLYLTNLGSNRLLRGLGECRFADVTAEAGVDDPRWSVPATFFDFDRDGDLDLWVGNYVDFSAATHQTCFQANSAPDYCGPASFRAEPDRLFRNLGDGRFADVTVAAGLAGAYGKALGGIAFDADGDGWSDLFVANDATDNLLWRNRGDGTFAEEGLARGVAVNAAGARTGDMGVDAADFDGDGDDDLVSTHIVGEGASLWRNDGSGHFWDASAALGVLAPTLGLTGFGVGWLDADRDGRLDLFVANGAVRILDQLWRAGDARPLRQPSLLLCQQADGRYGDCSARAGELFAAAEVSRGTAFGDVDNDGDIDFVVTANDGPARLVLDAGPRDEGWIGLRLVTGPGGRDALGARVEVARAAGPPLVRRVRTDGSYASASDPRLTVRLGPAGRAIGLRVRWPDGTEESFPAPPAGRYTTLRQGEGARR
ncbi:MAG TPA: CRTAC1 family protein [Thermoanaerobaculia bacterium]|nr:CRTAC1 family protein [Thermoanaerobaculia bacterium]